MCVCNGTDWCTLNQDCSSLGYKKQTCPERTIKCPFDTSYVYCISCQSEYQYTCSGTGYAGGTGSACGGKYTQCKCASGYKWDATSGTCKADRAVCEIGTLYYSDNTCSSNLESGKTLLGVVIYSNSPSAGGWIMTVNPIQTYIYWSMEENDISGLSNYTSWSSAAKDFDSCGNTDKIRAQGDSSTYPAAWAAYNYQPPGTPTGKRWCLPAAGLINSLYNNWSAINTAIGKAGGTELVNNNEDIWSSSEYNYSFAWYFFINGSGGLGYTYKSSNRGSKGNFSSVRPVMEF